MFSSLASLFECKGMKNYVNVRARTLLKFVKGRTFSRTKRERKENQKKRKKKFGESPCRFREMSYLCTPIIIYRGENSPESACE